jgi:serine O-acetyltransferase
VGVAQVARPKERRNLGIVLLRIPKTYETLARRHSPISQTMIYIFRLSHFLYRHRIPFLPRLLKIINRILFSISLPPSVQVGRNVIFGYQGLGIVVHKDARLGSNVTISPNVVIAGKGEESFNSPIIEDDVVIGAGACILGPVRIGQGAVVGANSVVLTDVAPLTTVVGIPARPTTGRENSLKSTNKY